MLQHNQSIQIQSLLGWTKYNKTSICHLNILYASKHAFVFIFLGKRRILDTIYVLKLNDKGNGPIGPAIENNKIGKLNKMTSM